MRSAATSTTRTCSLRAASRFLLKLIDAFRGSGLGERIVEGFAGFFA
jgi:hypothetical protein